MITLRHVDKSYGNLVIFKDLNWSAKKAGMYIISGKPGSGKSTFLNLLMGEKYDAGEIILKAKPIYMLQEAPLIDSLKIKDNILLGKKADENYYRLIQKLEIVDLEKHYPHEVSGGQRQRVGIARSLLNDASIILCDEPTESLDEENKDIVLSLLKDLSKDRIIIVVSHDSYLLNNYGDYFYHLQEHKLIEEKTLRKKDKAVSKIAKRLKALDYGRFWWRLNHRFYVFLLILLILLSNLMALGLMIYESWFSIDDSKASLNADYVYLSRNEEMDFALQKDEIIAMLEVEESTLRPILKADSYYFNKRKYRAVIYPHPLLEGFGGVYINEALVKQTGQSDGNIEIIFDLNGRLEALSLPIVEVIEEKDFYNPAIYYDYAEMENFLHNLADEDRAYELFLAHLDLIELKYDYGKIEDLKNNPRLADYTVIAPLYDERLRLLEDQKLYRLFYSGLLFIMAIVIFIVIFELLKSRHKQNSQAFKIALSNGYEAKSLNLCNLLYLLGIIFIFALLISGEILLLGKLVFAIFGLALIIYLILILKLAHKS